MRKRLIGPEPPVATGGAGDFLDLERIATVEVTSEDPRHPVESALVPGTGEGWRAAAPGPQKVRLLFDAPQRIRRVRLVFEERDVERTQEFALSWVSSTPGAGGSLLRQQYTFSPGGATREVEDFAFDLGEATALELEIVPEIGGGGTHASLVSFQVA
jgi:hypothetical protein